MTGNPDSIPTKVLASFMAGVISACVSLPPDNVKTKMMKMKPDANGVLPYSGFFNCMKKSIQNEGFFALWVGLPTYIGRVTPHAVITLLMNDFLTTMWRGYTKY